MVTQTLVADDVETDVAAPHSIDLDICEALYWVRRSRVRRDTEMLRTWTERLDALLDWRFSHPGELETAA